MRTIEHAVEIDASPERVWEVLTDFEAYDEWNPFLTHVDGRPEEGARLKVTFQPPGGRRVRMRPTLKAVTPLRELRWLGRAGIPGLFDGEHRFAIDILGGGRTRLVQSEVFHGLLVPLFKTTIARAALGFAAMNEAMKARAERDHAEHGRGDLDRRSGSPEVQRLPG